MPSSDFDSSSASDKDILPGARTPRSESDFDCLECDTLSTHSGSCWNAAPDETSLSKPVMEVKLFDFVGDTPPPPPPVKIEAPAVRTKLSSAARPFASSLAPTAGIQMVLSAAKNVFECDPGVFDVQMVEGVMGGTWTIVAHTRGPFRNPRYLLGMVKNALLTTAEHSRDTYILGYDVKPFTKIDKCSFSATLSTIPDAQQKNACWDSYTNGFCPRRISCRWTHPAESQVMRLVVRIQHEAREVQEGEIQEAISAN